MQRPIFSHISVGYTDDVIDITFETRDENNIVLNLPILLDKDKYFEFEVVNGIDNERLFEIGIRRKVVNDPFCVFRSHIILNQF